MKKHYVILVAVLLLIAGLTALAIHKYENRPQSLTINQAVDQRDTALRGLAVYKELDRTHQSTASKRIDSLKADNKTLTTQKSTLCAQIKTARLYQPLCQ